MGDDSPKGVLLAGGIVLLWLAGLAFYVALEGSTIVGQPVPPKGHGGGAYVRTIFRGLAALVNGVPADEGSG